MCGEHSPCSGHTGFALYRGVCAFPVCTAQAPGCSIWSRPCVACGSSFRVLHKSMDSVAPAFCAFPSLSGSGSQRLGQPLSGRCASSLRGERPRQPEAWAPSPGMRRSFSLCGEWLGQPEACAPSPRVRRAFSLRGERLRKPEARAHSPQVWRAFSLRSPSVFRRLGACGLLLFRGVGL